MLEEKILDLISPSLEVMGLDVVQVSMLSDDNRVLRILLDRFDSNFVSISDCEKASCQISAMLDVEIKDLDKYTLEVSSAGIDRPLTKLRDFEKFKGKEVKVELLDAVKGAKKIRGKIVKVESSKIFIESNIKPIKQNVVEAVLVDFENIRKAKLVLSDDLTKKKTN